MRQLLVPVPAGEPAADAVRRIVEDLIPAGDSSVPGGTL
jgi:hypothetical protein